MRPASERDCLEFVGVVREQRGGGFYIVDCQAGALRREVVCTLGGRVHMHRIRVVAGDEVTVEVSPYDLRRGRITFRGRREERRT